MKRRRRLPHRPPRFPTWFTAMTDQHCVEPTPVDQAWCLPRLLEHQARCRPDRLAILAPGRRPLTYARLFEHVDQTARTLRGMGIERNDRIAVLLPNGPELTVAILATAACGVCVPMNTAYETSELDRYFDDIRPSALILESGLDTAARSAARAHAIPIIELSASNDDEAGVFTFAAARSGSPSLDTARADDAMLLLLTSGTTSRAKIVQLTHANVCASAFSSTAALALGEKRPMLERAAAVSWTWPYRDNLGIPRGRR